MMTKYWSAFLVVALALTALADARRAAYFRSRAPWVTALVFLLAVLPHAIWLVYEHFPPLTWVVTRRVANTPADFVRSLAVYVVGTVGYASLSLLLVAFMFRPPHAPSRDAWFAWDPVRRRATILFWAPLLLPILAALVTHTSLQSIWNAPALNLLPVMMLATRFVVTPRIAVQRLVAVVSAITLAVVASSPFVALVILKLGVENQAAYAQLAARALEREWRATTDRPLRIVAGTFALASSTAFYIPDKPSTYADFSLYLSPWINDARLRRDGVAIVCPSDDPDCLKSMSELQALGPAGGRRAIVTLRRHWLGFTGEPRDFVIATVPPRS
jgi:hypothetical protein